MTSGICAGSAGSFSGGLELEALDGRGRVALEDRPILCEGQLLGRLLDRVPVGILRPTFDVVDVRPVDGERNTQSDKRFALTQMRNHAIARGLDGQQVTRADGCRHRAARRADVHHPASGDVSLERAGGLLFDLAPGLVGDRRQLAVEVVHCGCPFRLPIDR
jgi:hypothetical protein